MIKQEQFEKTVEDAVNAHHERATETFNLFEALYKPYTLAYRRKYGMTTTNEGLQ